MNFLARTSALLTLAIVAGCSSFSGDLRQDLNDNPYPKTPTTGGKWVEGGYLSEDMSEGAPSIYADRNSGRGTSGANGPGDSSRTWAESSTPPNLPGDGTGVLAANPPSYTRQMDLPPPVKRQYKNGNRATKADFVDDVNEGSLWASDGQTNYYFTKNKVRGVGDILTITSDAQLLKDISTEIARTLTPNERDHEVDLAQARINAKAAGQPDPDAPAGTDATGSSAAAPARAPASAGADKKPGDDTPTPEVRRAGLQDIDVSRSVEMKAGDPIMAEIVERYPNGNYKVRGTKRVNYKQGTRFVTLTAIVKSADIDDNETVASGKLYEYRLEAFR